jgi:hypothetical protein
MFINFYNEEMEFLEDSERWRGLFPRRNTSSEMSERSSEKKQKKKQENRKTSIHTTQ